MSMTQDDFLSHGNIKRLQEKLHDSPNDSDRRVLKELLSLERQRLAEAHRLHR